MQIYEEDYTLDREWRSLGVASFACDPAGYVSALKARGLPGVIEELKAIIGETK